MRVMQTEAGAPLSASPPRPRRYPLLVALVAVVSYTADLLTKEWALQTLEPGERRPLLAFLDLHLIFNSGAAFSFGMSATWLVTLLACAVTIGIMFTVRRLASRGWAVALGLLLGGALGNLTDRFFRAPGPGRGHVVDFLALPYWPIFNLADVAVVSGALLVGLLSVIGVGLDGRRG